jgi:Clostripain family
LISVLRMTQGFGRLGFLGIFILLFSGPLSAAEKEWTFLVFINGHNNLSPYADMNIKDMERTGSTDRLNMLVEWGSMESPLTRRLYIEKSTDPTRVTSPVLMEMPNYDMGDVKNLVEFVKWGITNYPAKKYFVAVWNHGSGWAKRSMFTPLDISFDDHTGNAITTEQLGQGMAEIHQLLGRPIDIYGSDACLMQMIEVAGEMKGHVRYFVGSQDLEPAEGWPYAPFIKTWAERPEMSAAEVSVLLSREYLKSYSGGVYGNRDVTFSAWDMAYLSPFYEELTVLREDLMKAPVSDFAAIKQAANYSLNFACIGCVDLGDFLRHLKNVRYLQGKESLQRLEKVYKQLVLSTDNSEAFREATGVSVWLPNWLMPNLQTRYEGLRFSQATGWGLLTQRLVQ